MSQIIMREGAGSNSYENFARIRSAAGMTNYQVAKKSRVSQSQLSRWKVHGLPPKTVTLLKICSAVGCTVEDVFSSCFEEYDADDG